MKHPLAREFFNRSTLLVANGLLGKFLVRRFRGQQLFLMITEVEAYDGFKDRASHASRGLTVRNQPMFSEAGKWYVYFTYGMHWMLNIVTQKKGYPAAVLIRAGRTEKGELIKGPARLAKYLRIDKRLNGQPASKKSGLWLEDRGFKVSPAKIKKAPRVGVAYAGPYWSKRHWRFYI